MQTTRRIRHALIALSMFSLAACGQASTETRSDAPLIAMTMPATDSPAAYRAGMDAPRPAARFPEDQLRDPAQRFSLLERLRAEVVRKTRRVPEPRWYNELRPALRRQLEQAGLARSDVDFLLKEIDQSRPRT